MAMNIEIPLPNVKQEAITDKISAVLEAQSLRGMYWFKCWGELELSVLYGCERGKNISHREL